MYIAHLIYLHHVYTQDTMSLHAVAVVVHIPPFGLSEGKSFSVCCDHWCVNKQFLSRVCVVYYIFFLYLEINSIINKE